MLCAVDLYWVGQLGRRAAEDRLLSRPENRIGDARWIRSAKEKGMQAVLHELLRHDENPDHYEITVWADEEPHGPLSFAVLVRGLSVVELLAQLGTERATSHRSGA